MSSIIQVIIVGIGVGVVYALSALGLVLIYRSTGLVNFAHGQLILVGGYIAFSIHVTLKMPYALAVVIAALAGAILGAVLYLGIFRYVDRFSIFQKVLVTIAVGSVVAGVVYGFAGSPPEVMTGASGTWSIRNVTIAKQTVAEVVSALAVIYALQQFLQRTWLGRIVRARVSNPVLSAMSGIRGATVLTVTWALSVGLATFAGAMTAPEFVISMDQSVQLLIFSLAVAVIGGSGGLQAVLTAGLVLGVGESLVEYFAPALSSLAPMLLFAAVLVVWPRGFTTAPSVRTY